MIPASSEILLDACISGEITPTQHVIVDLIKTTKNHGFLVPRALVDQNKSKVQISTMNYLNRNITITKDNVVGTIQIVEEVVPVDSNEFDTNKMEETKLPEHLQCILDKVSPKVDTEQKLKIKHLLIEYQDIFMGPDGKLGHIYLLQHVIDTGNAKPVKQPPRRVPIAQREIIEKELGKMLTQNIIQPSDSPWSSRCLLVKKSDSTYRFCVDYRKVNELTRKDAYPLPRIDGSLNSLGRSKFFGVLDMTSDYWQIEVAEQFRPVTAFTCHKGLFEFRVMPFGLTNAPACFEKLMELVLKGLLWERCLCYIDDINTFSAIFDQAFENLKLVVSDKGIKCDPKKIEAVCNWPVPSNASDVRSFIEKNSEVASL